jgi:hypothetical protein
MHRLLLGLLALVVCVAAAPAVRAEEDDEPISVPFKDMTDEEWAEMQARQVAFQVAWIQWKLYDDLTCVYQHTYEDRLNQWRTAVEAWNKDPSLPDPGPRPSEQGLPPRPSVDRPGAMPPFQGCPGL